MSTWRQPEIQPLQPVRYAAATVADVCAAMRDVLGSLDLELLEDTGEDAACVLETDYKRLTETGGNIERLDDVAYLGNQGFFAHGRYLVTATMRATSEGSRIRVTVRIEGYDGGYRQLRSRGLIERAVFERLADNLGIELSEPATPVTS